MTGPTLAEVEARMRPGAFSQAGFLAAGERLEQVLARDRELLTGLGLEAAALAAPLDRLLSVAEGSRLRWARVGAVLVRISVHRGFQLCPWTSNPPNQCTAGGR